MHDCNVLVRYTFAVHTQRIKKIALTAIATSLTEAEIGNLKEI